MGEFGHALFALKLDICLLNHFMKAVDKDNDGHIQYEEFVDWMLRTGGGGYLKKDEVVAPGSNDDLDDDSDRSPELTLADLKSAVGPKIDASKWPDHTVRLANNMRDRFPDYPLEGLVWMMIKNDFHGGKVVDAIRDTSTTEIEAKPRSMDAAGFPAKYQVRWDQKPIEVYKQQKSNWSFPLMRDERIPSHGKFNKGQEFWVLEVKTGVTYGVCFGRVEWNGDYSGANYWCVLGLEVEHNAVGTKQFSKAQRLTL